MALTTHELPRVNNSAFIFFVLFARQACALWGYKSETLGRKPSSMSGTVVCYYSDTLHASLGSIFFIPALVSFAMSVAGWLTHEIIFFFFGMHLFVGHTYLINVNAFYYTSTMTTDPVCPDHLMSTFPSQPTYYVCAIATIVLLYCARHRRFAIVPIGAAVAAAIGLPVGLGFLGYNSWVDILVSAVVAISTTALFYAMLICYVEPNMTGVLQQQPFRFFGYRDTFICSGPLCVKNVAMTRAIVEDLMYVQRLRKAGRETELAKQIEHGEVSILPPYEIPKKQLVDTTLLRY